MAKQTFPLTIKRLRGRGFASIFILTIDGIEIVARRVMEPMASPLITARPTLHDGPGAYPRLPGCWWWALATGPLRDDDHDVEGVVVLARDGSLRTALAHVVPVILSRHQPFVARLHLDPKDAAAREKGGHDMEKCTLQGVHFGKHFVSIQASRTHYCAPRAHRFGDLSKYFLWEVVLHATDDELRAVGVPEEDIERYWHEYPSGWVPSAVIQRAADALEREDGQGPVLPPPEKPMFSEPHVDDRDVIKLSKDITVPVRQERVHQPVVSKMARGLGITNITSGSTMSGTREHTRPMHYVPVGMDLNDKFIPSDFAAKVTVKGVKVSMPAVRRALGPGVYTVRTEGEEVVAITREIERMGK